MRLRDVSIAVLVACVACVPDADDVEEFGSVGFSMRASEASSKGFVTDDGWEVSFSKILLPPPSIGDYRGYDFTEGASPTQLDYDYECDGIRDSSPNVFGIVAFDPRAGIVEKWNRLPPRCEYTFVAPSATQSASISTSRTSQPGPGMTAEDAALVRRVSEERSGVVGGNYGVGDYRPPVIIIRGTATKFERRVDFAFDVSTVELVEACRFFEGSCLNLRDVCGAVFAGAKVKALERTWLDVVFHAEDLFQDAHGPLATSSFELFALADEAGGTGTVADPLRQGNGDGVVTVDELARVKFTDKCTGTDSDPPTLFARVARRLGRAWRFSALTCPAERPEDELSAMRCGESLGGYDEGL